jgi:hypothetical protein
VILSAIVMGPFALTKAYRHIKIEYLV